MLTVEIISFSYKYGVPIDSSEHGGGFVFDCRSLDNPGREERFKSMTGKDALVIEFLEKNGEAASFCANVEALVDRVVQKYQKRGFEHLSIAFGCTGGQHRSVYVAERLARHLREAHQVNIIVKHRERPEL